MKPIATLILGVIALSACVAEPKSPPGTAAAGSGPRKCFWANNVSSFNAVDENTVNIRVGVKDVYQLVMFAPCRDVDWAHQIAITSRGGSSICDGFDAEVVAPTTQGPRRCAVREIRHLSPEEVAALPAKARP